MHQSYFARFSSWVISASMRTLTYDGRTVASSSCKVTENRNPGAGGNATFLFVPLTQVCPLLRADFPTAGRRLLTFSAPGSQMQDSKEFLGRTSICHQTGKINHPAATMGGVWSASTTLWESTVGGLCIGELVGPLVSFAHARLGQNPRKQETPRRQIFLRPALF